MYPLSIIKSGCTIITMKLNLLVIESTYKTNYSTNILKAFGCDTPKSKQAYGSPYLGGGCFCYAVITKYQFKILNFQ